MTFFISEKKILYAYFHLYVMLKIGSRKCASFQKGRKFQGRDVKGDSPRRFLDDEPLKIKTRGSSNEISSRRDYRALSRA